MRIEDLISDILEYRGAVRSASSDWGLIVRLFRKENSKTISLPGWLDDAEKQLGNKRVEISLTVILDWLKYRKAAREAKNETEQYQQPL